MRLFRDSTRREDELYSLCQWLSEQGFTAILTVKSHVDHRGEATYPFLDYLSDCVLVLDQRISEQVSTRRLRVMKYRGSGYVSNECPFLITSGGVVLMPVSSAELVERSLGATCSSGDDTLDEMLGGGYRQGSTVLITGPTGCGKTTLACTFAQAAGKHGERTLYISFEEGRQSIVSVMRSPGLDLAPLIDAGVLTFLTAMPESMGVEEHLLRILEHIDRLQPAHVVVDAISATVRMGTEGGSFDFLVRLLTQCEERGITCIYLNQVLRGAAHDHISGIGISSLIDTAIVLDYVWEGDELGRSLFILKSRGTSHSHRLHRLMISDNGIIIGPPAACRGGEEA